MMVLAGFHGHHAFAAWPIMVAVGVVLVVACAAIALLARRPQSAVQGVSDPGRFGSYATDPRSTGPSMPEEVHDQEGSRDTHSLDAKILAMLRQKGEPMPQSEIEANLGIQADSLGPWLAGMERRAMLRRTWNPARATYVVHVPAES